VTKRLARCEQMFREACSTGQTSGNRCASAEEHDIAAWRL
jgi:hypothetical protein